MSLFRLVCRDSSDQFFRSFSEWLLENCGAPEFSRSAYNDYKNFGSPAGMVFSEMYQDHYNFCLRFSAVSAIENERGPGYEFYIVRARKPSDDWVMSPFILDIKIEDDVLAIAFKLKYCEYMT